MLWDIVDVQTAIADAFGLSAGQRLNLRTDV